MEALDIVKNTLFNLINQELDIDKTYLYAKDPYEEKCQLLINKGESTHSKYKNTTQIRNGKYWSYFVT